MPDEKKEYVGKDRLTDILKKIKTLVSDFYKKPTNGIPKSDLESSIQTSLGKADTIDAFKEDVDNNPLRIKFGEQTTLVNNITLSFHKDGDNEWYCTDENPITGFTSADFKENVLYKVTWDGIESEHFYMALENSPSDSSTAYYEWGCIGNSDIIGRNAIYKTNVDFCIAYDYHRNSDEIQIFTSSTKTNHTLQIKAIPFVKNENEKYLHTEKTSLIRRGNGLESIIIGSGSVASGECSTALGVNTIASGESSTALGRNTIASGTSSTALGLNNIASGDYSIAFGARTTANAYYAMAGGINVSAFGNSSIAVGQRTITNANMGQAFGNYTVSNGRCQHVTGQYNITDDSPIDSSHGGGARKYLDIIGNGTSEDNRSNAYTLDWDGNGWYAGDIESKNLKTNDGTLFKFSSDEKGNYGIIDKNNTFIPFTDQVTYRLDGTTLYITSK